MDLPRADAAPWRALYAGLTHEYALLEGLAEAPIFAWAESLRGCRLSTLPRIPSLEHRLSAEILARSPDDVFEPRSASEAAILGLALELLEVALRGSAESFPEHLSKIHATCCGTELGLRNRGVISQPDRTGSYVRFPEAPAVRPALERLHRFLRSSADNRPMFAATVAMTAVGNIHPFVDGNGRLSRVLFNALLSRRGRSVPYIPLHELGRVSRGGLLIALRLAQYRGDWSELARFIGATLRVLPHLRPGAYPGGPTPLAPTA